MSPSPASHDPISVLLIEDSAADAALVEKHLKACADPSFVFHHETTLAAGISRLQNTRVDVVVLDLTLPDSSGLETLRPLRSWTGDIPVVILSDQAEDAFALEAMRGGAEDFFAKSEVMSESLGRLLQFAIERFRRQQAEREIATAGFVQRRLFPKQPPSIPGMDVAGRCDPAGRVGGDYFDYFMDRWTKRA